MSSINVPVRAEFDIADEIVQGAELTLVMCEHCFAMIPASKTSAHYQAMRHGA